MQTQIESSAYQNGKRIVVQTVTYSLSDDLFQLGNLQNQMAHIVRRIEEVTTVEPNGDRERELARLQVEHDRLSAELTVQYAIVHGYELV